MPINYAVLNGIAQHLGWDERMPEITKENFYNLGQTLNQDDTNAFLGMLSKISEQFVYSTKYNADDNPFQPFLSLTFLSANLLKELLLELSTVLRLLITIMVPFHFPEKHHLYHPLITRLILKKNTELQSLMRRQGAHF